MKIYRATDNYRSKERWFETEGKANFQASAWASALDAEAFLNDRDDFNGADWVSVDCFTSKEELIVFLNLKATKYGTQD